MRIPLIILFLLTGPWLIGHMLRPGDAERADTLGLAGLVLAFLFFGVGHFAMTDQMVEMLPPRLPARRAIVLLTGALEFGLALGLAIPATRPAAGLVCAAVLIAFFPVNVYASVRRRGGGGHEWGPIYLLLRAPLQGALLLWTVRFAL